MSKLTTEKMIQLINEDPLKYCPELLDKGNVTVQEEIALLCTPDLFPKIIELNLIKLDEIIINRGYLEYLNGIIERHKEGHGTYKAYALYIKYKTEDEILTLFKDYDVFMDSELILFLRTGHQSIFDEVLNKVRNGKRYTTEKLLNIFLNFPEEFLLYPELYESLPQFKFVKNYKKILTIKKVIVKAVVEYKFRDLIRFDFHYNNRKFRVEVEVSNGCYKPTITCSESIELSYEHETNLTKDELLILLNCFDDPNIYKIFSESDAHLRQVTVGLIRNGRIPLSFGWDLLTDELKIEFYNLPNNDMFYEYSKFQNRDILVDLVEHNEFRVRSSARDTLDKMGYRIVAL